MSDVTKIIFVAIAVIAGLVIYVNYHSSSNKCVRSLVQYSQTGTHTENGGGPGRPSAALVPAYQLGGAGNR